MDNEEQPNLVPDLAYQIEEDPNVVAISWELVVEVSNGRNGGIAL